MVSRSKAGELIVPGVVLIGCLLYWMHVQDARSVAQRVPLAVIVFTVLMLLMVVGRTVLGTAWASEDTEADAPSTDRRIFVNRALFIALCAGYFVAFGRLGFDLANVVFLLLAYPLAGLKLVWTIPAAIASSAVFHVLASVMEFNVPAGPFGF